MPGWPATEIITFASFSPGDFGTCSAAVSSRLPPGSITLPTMSEMSVHLQLGAARSMVSGTAPALRRMNRAGCLVPGATVPKFTTGGYVYRGCRIPDLQGTYFFSDYVNGNIWTFRYNAATNTKTEFQNRNSTLGTSIEGGVVNQYASFGEDANGELYIADHGGQIYKIIPASGDGPCTPPPAPGDLNGDGRVDGADLGLLLAGWGTCGTPCPADLDANGVVNGADIGILLGNWG